MKPWTLLPVTRALGALVLAAALAPAGAAPVSFSFVAPVTSGPFTGQVGSGVIRFDTADLDAFGSGILSPATSTLEIDFSFGGQTFHESHDPGFPDFPELIVSDGSPVGIDFLLEQGSAGVDFADDTIQSIQLLGTLLPPAPGRTADPFVAPIDIVTGEPGVVPEPATFALAGLALLGLARHRRGARS